MEKNKISQGTIKDYFSLKNIEKSEENDIPKVRLETLTAIQNESRCCSSKRKRERSEIEESPSDKVERLNKVKKKIVDTDSSDTEENYTECTTESEIMEDAKWDELKKSWKTSFDAMLNGMAAQVNKDIMNGFDKMKEEHNTMIKKELEVAKSEVAASVEATKLEVEMKIEKDREERKKVLEEIVREKNRLEGITSAVGESESNELKKQLITMQEELEKAKREKIKNNITISGLQLEKENLKNKIEEFIKEKLEVDVICKKAYKNRKEIVFAELNSFEEKTNVMKNANKLKSTKIFINNELTDKEMKIQWKLREFMKEEIKNGKRVKLGYQKLTIDNVVHKWSEKEGKFFRE